MSMVTVSAVIMGKRDIAPALPTVNLQLNTELITARELIRLAVTEQILSLMQEYSGDFGLIQQRLKPHYLEQETIERQQQKGKIALPVERNFEVDVAEEVLRAQQAFAARRFKLFVDAVPVFELDDECALHEGSTVRFIRLIALVGG